VVAQSATPGTLTFVIPVLCPIPIPKCMSLLLIRIARPFMDSHQTPPPTTYSVSASCNTCSGSPEGNKRSGLTRSLGPDVQVARLAVALLVQCFAVREPKEPTASCSYCREDGIAAAVRGSDGWHVAFEGCWTYPRKDIVMLSC
jgi:hypothetical protein